MNRKIPRYPNTSKKSIYLYGTLIGVILITLFLSGVISAQRLKHPPQYNPPAFDNSAQIGEPTPPIDLGYTSMTVEPGFDIKLCGRLFIEKDRVEIYLTNPKFNDVWVMTELRDDNGKVLARSGIIKQGEYLKSIKVLKNVTADKTNVKIVVIAYSPDTYISRGSVSMKTVLFNN